MDETVYQCPECNFNADNLKELDIHIIDNHSKNLSNIYQADENYHNDYIRDDNFIDDDEMDNNQHNNSNNMNGYHNDDIEDDDEDFFNERSQNLPNKDYLNQLDVNKDIMDESDDLVQEDDEDFFNENQAKINMNFKNNPTKAVNGGNRNIPINQFNNNSISHNQNSRAPNNMNRNIRPYPQQNNNLNNSKNQTQSILNTSNVLNSDNHYERQYACKSCDFFTNNPRAVLYHRKEFHNEKINVHECSYCQYASQYSGKVERHTLLRHKIDINTNTSNSSPANKTMNNSINNNRPIERTLSQTSNLPSSNLSHRIANQIHSNNVQNDALNNNDSLNNINKFQCDKCPCKYKRSSDLTKHLRIKHGIFTNVHEYLRKQQNNNSQNFENNNNNNNNTNNDDLYNENDDLEEIDEYRDINNSKHSPSQPSSNNNNNNFNKSLMANRNFNQIQRRTINESSLPNKSAGSQKSLECPYCTYHSNGNDSEYLTHVKDHLCGKSFRCVLCNSVYKYRGDCVVHLKRKHQKADMVAHTYVDRFDLDKIELNQICSYLKPKQHEDLENEEKLFGCAYCDYKANYKGDVFKHQTRRHPGNEKSVLPLGNNLTMNNSRSNYSNGMMNGTLNESNRSYSENNLNNTSYLDNTNKMNSNYDDEVDEDDNFYHGDDNENDYNDDVINLNNEDDVDNMNDIMDEEEDLFNERSNINNNNNNNNNNNQSQEEYENDEDIIEDNNENYNNYNSGSQVKNASSQNHQQMNGLTTTSKYQCKFCPFIGKNSAKLQLHLATHYNIKQYMCPVCNRRANFKWDIQKHLRKIHNNYELDVIILSEAEARKSISSYIQHNNGSSYTLNNVISSTKPAFTNGDSPVSNNANVNYSPNFKFANRHSLREKKFKCSLCTRTSKWQWDIKKHIRTVHKNKTGDVIVLNSKEIANMNNSLNENASHHEQHQQDQQQNLNSSLPVNFNNRAISSNSLFRNSIINLKSQQQQSTPGVQQPSQNYVCTSIGSDSTGNKKFKCGLCVYRSNWKADIFRHARKRHFIANPGQQHVIMLAPDVAAKTLEEYERLHGVNIRKRGRIDMESTSIQYSPMTDTISANPNNNNNNKRIKTDLSSVASTATTLSTMQSSNYNDDQNYNDGYIDQNDDFVDENYDSNYEDENNTFNNINSNNDENLNDTYNDQQTDHDHEDTVERLPVKASELNVKPYKCLKCGFRSDRKSDTLRHIRTKHAIMQAFNFLRILSIQEASRTIDHYLSTRGSTKRSSRNSSDYNPPSITIPTNKNNNSFISSNTTTTSNNNNNNNSNLNHIRNTSNINNIVSKNDIMNNNQNKSSENFKMTNCHKCEKESQASIDYYKCPFCSYKHMNKLVMRRHLGIHFNVNQKVNQHFKCSKCSFKSLWQYTVKSHVLKSHFGSPNVQVLRITNKLKSENLNSKKIESTAQNQNKNINGGQININLNGHNDQEYEEQNENNSNQINQTIHEIASYNNNSVNDDGEEKRLESVILTGFDGAKFSASYLVSASSASLQNTSLNLNTLMNSNHNNNINKKKMYYCQTCPYKTSNYCNLKQHLVQHRFQEGFFKCRYCTYYVSMLRLLKQHEILHPEFEPRDSLKQSAPSKTSNMLSNNNYSSCLMSAGIKAEFE